MHGSEFHVFPHCAKTIIKHYHFYRKSNIFSVKSTFLLKKLLKEVDFTEILSVIAVFRTFPHCSVHYHKIKLLQYFYCKLSSRKIILVYLSEAIKVLIIVIFRVFFDDDNKMTHFFVDGNTELKKFPESANSSKLAKLQKTPKFHDENIAFFVWLPILWYLHSWDCKKYNQIYIFIL